MKRASVAGSIVEDVHRPPAEESAVSDAMAQANLRSSAPRETGYASTSSTGWTGWIVFAGTMMALIGSLHVIQGLLAVLDEEYYLATDGGLAVTADYTAWGWTHIVAGAVVIAAGVGVVAGRIWARVVGVTLAVVSALLNFTFMAAYPIWSAIVIALDVFVILALTVHGRDAETI